MCSSNVDVVVSPAIAISRVTGAKPIISTRTFHDPSASAGAEHAVLIGDGGELLIALRRRDRRPRHGKPVEADAAK